MKTQECKVIKKTRKKDQKLLILIDEMNTTCCYAVQDKVWVHDPDGNAKEVFFTKEDSEFESAGEPWDVSLCCAPPSTPVAIEFGSFKQ
jgi:hypothetical protein